jgi:hypothetical protein
MNNKILIWIVVFLLLLVWVLAFHITNKDKMMDWNPIHNMMMWDKIDMDMWEWDDDWMKEHCKMMPEMKW